MTTNPLPANAVWIDSPLPRPRNVLKDISVLIIGSNEPDHATVAFVDMFFGVAVAAIVGWLAIDVVLRLLKRVGLKWFGVYRILLALLLLIVIS